VGKVGQRQRHKIQTFFCRMKDCRRIAMRFDKLARNFLAAIISLNLQMMQELQVDNSSR
jgi:transposase